MYVPQMNDEENIARALWALVEVLSRELPRIGMGNAHSSEGIGAIEGLTMKIMTGGDQMVTALHNIASVLEEIKDDK